MWFAIGIGGFIVYEFIAGQTSSDSSGNSIDDIVAQNTAEALQNEANQQTNENLQMTLQYGLQGQTIAAQAAIAQTDITSEAQTQQETIAANTAAYITDSNNQAQEQNYSTGLVAAQNITAMQIKGAAASHAANAMSAEAQSVGQVIQSVAADNAQIAVANTSAV